uniref:Tyrosine phosphatase n=1 Tax=Pristionchus pacificus TaxID=54126 RepID=A0A8R1UTI7_PRIPA
MSSEKSREARNWADWVLNSGWRAIANQFDETVDWYTVSNESKAFDDNQDKCRYYNVGCFDWNRIVLKDRSPHNDFYHANSVYLKGDDHFHVIAAQGPLYNTTDEFWELIYQEKVSTIVQLCNFTEEYWPKKNKRTFGDYTVSLEKEDLIDENVPDVQLRTFTVRKEGESESHMVNHIFYKKWPDYSVPQTVTPLITIVRWLEENGGMGKESPILVHCLAGIGRTGTLIVTLMGLRSIRTTNQLEEPSNFVMELAKELRRHRDGSIQTSQQYIYAHSALIKLFAIEGLIEDDDRVKNFRYVNAPVF